MSIGQTLAQDAAQQAAGYARRLVRAAARVETKAGAMAERGLTAEAGAMRRWARTMREGVAPQLEAGAMRPDAAKALVKLATDETAFSGAVRAHRLAIQVPVEATTPEQRFPIWARNREALAKAVRTMKGATDDGEALAALRTVITASDPHSGPHRLGKKVLEIAHLTGRADGAAKLAAAGAFEKGVEMSDETVARHVAWSVRQTAFPKGDRELRLAATRKALALPGFPPHVRAQAKALVEAADVVLRGPRYHTEPGFLGRLLGHKPGVRRGEPGDFMHGLDLLHEALDLLITIR